MLYNFCLSRYGVLTISPASSFSSRACFIRQNGMSSATAKIVQHRGNFFHLLYNQKRLFCSYPTSYKKKISISIKNTGIRQLNDQSIYPKNDGILIPFSSAIERTIKFGALPIQVLAPINTAPQEIAIRIICGMKLVSVATPELNPKEAAVVKNTR